MKVLELMKVHVIKAGEDATLGDAVDMMDLYQITTLPIVDGEDRPIGVISESDIVQAVLPPFLESTGKRSGVESASRLPDRGASIAESMSGPIIAIDEGADVLEAAQIMLDRDFKRLPVTSAGRLVGTIGRIDICQAILEGQLTAPELTNQD